MKKIIAISLLIFFFTGRGSAQKKDSSAAVIRDWFPSAIVGINASQVAFSNWTKGGENQITWTLIGNFGLKYLSPEWTFRNNLKVAYGRTKLGSSEFRTNDNEFYLENVASKNIGWAVDPYFSSTVRTALTTGYKYKKDSREAIADFFDPGYITQGIGFTFDKYAGIKTRLGFAVEETFTNKYRQYSDDKNTSRLEAFKIETGMESVTHLEYEIMENVTVKSMLRLFTRYEHLDVWDIRWDTTFTGKINSYLNFNFIYLFIYEKNQSVTAQMKQALQLGFIYTIL